MQKTFVSSMKFILVPILMFLVATQDYIAKNLCENRARPKLKCGGKCQLMKKLAEEEKENAPAQLPAGKSTFQEVLFTAIPLLVCQPAEDRQKPALFPPLQHWKTFSPPCTVFHPPLL